MVTTSGTEANRTLRRSTISRALDGSPTDAVLVQAAAANQTEWFARTAAAAGGVVRREEGVTWTSAPGGAVFAFPKLSSEKARRVASALPRRRRCARSVLLVAAADRAPELADALRAAGFRDGWQANWMSCDLGEARLRVRDAERDGGRGVAVSDGRLPVCRRRSDLVALTAPASRR
jgi:hypothetical protein